MSDNDGLSNRPIKTSCPHDLWRRHHSRTISPLHRRVHLVQVGSGVDSGSLGCNRRQIRRSCSKDTEVLIELSIIQEGE